MINKFHLLIFIIIHLIFSTAQSNSQIQQGRSDFQGRMQDSSNVNLIGRWANGPCFAVEVAGNRAYFGNGGYLEIVDFSNPAQPVELGKLLLPSAVMGVAVSGNYAYVANYFAGLRIVDIANPTNPKEVGMVQTNERSLGILIEGNYAYLADGHGGIRILDISNPSNPNEIGSYIASYQTRDVVVNGNFAYLANDKDGLLIIDISNPTQPTLANTLKTGNESHGVAVSGTYAYVADRFDGLRIIDVANPYSPNEIGFYDTDGIAHAVAVHGNFAFLADDYRGLRVIDVANPYNPQQAGIFDTDGSAYNIALSSNYAFVADYQNGLRMIDVSNYYQPNEIGYFETDGNSRGIAVNGNYAYIANGEGGLRILDISNPATPIKIGQYKISGFTHDVAVQDNYAYLTVEGSGLRVVNIADPNNPTEVSFYKQDIYAHNVVIEGSYAYVADWVDGLKIIDISNPLMPSLAGSVTLPQNRADGIAKKENYVYLAAGNDGLRIIDVSVPTQPAEVGHFATNGFATCVDVKGFTAYVGIHQNEIKIINISTLTNPVQVGSFILNDSPFGVHASGRYLYVANEGNGVRIIDVSNPSQATEVGYYDTGCWAYGGVTVYDNYIFLPDEMDGLYIMEFTAATLNTAPTEPILISIPDSSFINTATPQFLWEIPSDMNGDPLHFKLEITSDSSWQSIDYSFESVKNTSGFSPVPPVPSASGIMIYTMQIPLPETTWYWRVSAWDGFEYSEYSETWRFSVDVTLPILNSLSFENPGFGDDWFNPNIDSIVTVIVNYDELNPWFGYLFCDFLTDTVINSDLTSGNGQQAKFELPIANQTTEINGVVAQIKDRAGNIGVIESQLRLDAFPPFSYHSNAPDTIEAGQVYDVQILNAQDGQSGVSKIYLDVCTNPDSIPTTPRNMISGQTNPGVYYYRYYAEDYLGNRGEIKTDTTIIISKAPMFITFDTSQVKAGEEFWIEIQVGTEQQPVINLLGAAFELNYSNTQYVDVVSLDSIIAADFLGNDIIFLPKLEDEIGKVSIGITRKRENGGVDGYGTIVRIKYKTDPDTPHGTPVHFTFPSVNANDSAGNVIELIPRDTTIWIIQSISDFTMTVEPGTQIISQGDSADFNLTFEKIGDFNSQISLEITKLPPGMEAIYPPDLFDIPSAFYITFATTGDIVPDVYNPIITATGGGITHSDTVTVQVIAGVSPDFLMMVTPKSRSIFPGDSAQFDLEFQPINGFDDQISLQISNLPAGMDVTYPSDSFLIPTSFNITFATTDDILPGIYHPIIRATGGAITQTDTVTIQVISEVIPDFLMTVIPESRSIYPGEKTQFNLEFQPLYGFDAQISMQISDLPPGMDIDYPAGSFSIPASFDITFSTTDEILPGDYQPVILATGGGLTHQTEVKITVLERPDFIMTIIPDSQAVEPSGTVQFQISFEPVGDFNSQVTVEISIGSPEISAVFSSRPFDIPATFTIPFTTSHKITPGTYTPLVTASGSGITHQKEVIIEVIPGEPEIQNFGVLPNPFTPNEDGFNDYVEFKFPETLSGNGIIQIFDVNGRKIREIHNSIQWNGKDDSGKDMKPGAYIYIVKNGGKIVSKGIVSLAR